MGYLTHLGADAFGDQFVKLWESEGIDTSLVVRNPDAHTGLYFITYTESGHQFTYHRKRSAASRMRPEDLPEAAIASAKVLHLSGISQAISDSACDAVFRAIEIARANGVKVAYDPNLRLKLWPLSRARAVIHATAAQADLFLPSLEDVQQLTGLEEPEQIVDYYLNLGVKLVVLKLGKQGVLVATDGERHRVDGFKVDTIDATGAGDTFDGAYVTQWLNGAGLLEAARYANGAAALSTTGYGAVAPIPKAEVVRAFLKDRM